MQNWYKILKKHFLDTDSSLYIMNKYYIELIIIISKGFILEIPLSIIGYFLEHRYNREWSKNVEINLTTHTTESSWCYSIYIYSYIFIHIYMCVCHYISVCVCVCCLRDMFMFACRCICIYFIIIFIQ